MVLKMSEEKKKVEYSFDFYQLVMLVLDHKTNKVVHTIFLAGIPTPKQSLEFINKVINDKDLGDVNLDECGVMIVPIDILDDNQINYLKELFAISKTDDDRGRELSDKEVAEEVERISADITDELNE